MKTKLTNRLNLPRPIVEALLNDPYDSAGSDYTPSSLLKPARMARLMEMFPDDCVEDVSDRLYSLQGQAVHTILERAAKVLEAEGYVVEKRFHATLAVGDKIFKVSAQVDLYDPASATVSDYKNTSVYSLSHGVKSDHLYQLNLQAELLRRTGFPVEKLQIVGIFRDWSADRADNDSSYPQDPAVVQDVPILEPEEVVRWAKDRILQHEAAKRSIAQDTLASCTDEETWARTEDDSFAVEKKGTNRSLPGGKFKTAEEAKEFTAGRKDSLDLVVDRRYGKAVRCSRYCPARRVCTQWQGSPRNVQKRSPKRGVSKVLPPGFEDLE